MVSGSRFKVQGLRFDGSKFKVQSFKGFRFHCSSFSGLLPFDLFSGSKLSYSLNNFEHQTLINDFMNKTDCNFIIRYSIF